MTDKDDAEPYIETVTDQERDLAVNALNEFKKKNYNGCLQHLHKLEGRNNDFKVALNKAVVEYYKSDFRKTDAFEKTLQSICSQFLIRLEKLDEVDHSVVHYNQALVAFHQRQYTTSLRIMDRVYKFIEPMHDTLARQVSFLAIELQLYLKCPDKVMTFITYFENNLINGTVNYATKNNTKDNGNDNKAHVSEIEKAGYRKKLAFYKARCHLMKHNLNSALKEIQILNNSSIDSIFLTANLEYMKGNFQEAIKILTSVPQDGLIYNEAGESSSVMFYNNMGAIHQALGKPNLACYYLQKALKEDMNIQQRLKSDTGEKPLHIVGGSKYHEIIYNLGIALLQAGRATQAFDCLIIAVRRYHRNSRLWLRIAECCIMVHKESNLEDFDVTKQQKEMIVDIIGTRDKRKYVLTTNLSKDKKYSTESQSYAVPVPTLEFASICLRNANILIPSDTAVTPVPLFLIPGVTPPAPTPGPGPAPSNCLRPEEIVVLRNAILAASAYVSLCLGDYILALEHSQKLLTQPRLSSLHRLLGHLYAAESLVLLDRIAEAIDHLNPENVQDMSFELPLVEETKRTTNEGVVKTNPPTKWFPDNIQSAHAVMEYNLAVAKTMRGQLDQAAHLLKRIWQLRTANCKVPAHIIMLVIYIELQLGHADVARNLIKQYSMLNDHRPSG